MLGIEASTVTLGEGGSGYGLYELLLRYRTHFT